jgi:aminoglycoside phosphotransferase (APT) family kinase protein
MTTGKMHVGEVDTDASLVRRLLAAQFPQWADLPIEPVPSAGTDNALYRLGDDMAVRLPRIHWAAGVDKEHEWLPKLAPFLPLAIPVPLAKGNPGEGYPWQWSVYRGSKAMQPSSTLSIYASSDRSGTLHRRSATDRTYGRASR